MISTILFGVGFLFVIVYGIGFLTKQEFKTHTNLRIIVLWSMALGFFLMHNVSGIHLIYTFPLGIGLAFLGIKPLIRGTVPTIILIVSIIVWSFILMGLSSYFGTFA